LKVAEEEGAADEALERLKPYLLPEKTGEAKIVLTQVVSKSHSGPIPSAEELEHLERVLPGLANRVVSMAEKEQEARHSTTQSIVEKEFSLRKIGQWLAILALCLLLATVSYIASLGDTESAAWLGGATIVAVVSVFVTGRWFDAAEAEADAPPLPAAQHNKAQPNTNQKKLPRNSKPKRR